MLGNISPIWRGNSQNGTVTMTTSSHQLACHLIQAYQPHSLKVLLRVHQHSSLLRCHQWKWTENWIRDMLVSWRVNMSCSNRFSKKSTRCGNSNSRGRCLSKDTRRSMKWQSAARTPGDSDKFSKTRTTTHSQKSRSQTSLPRSRQSQSRRRSLLPNLQRRARRKKRKQQPSPIITLTTRTTE